MKKILILGAGRSTFSLIKYLLAEAPQNQWQITVGDLSLRAAQELVGSSPHAKAIAFDITNAQQRQQEIAAADLVISMLPAFLHLEAAKCCLANGVHLLTASYTPDEIRALHKEAQAKGVLMLMECGLDPGIDHMSAMKVIDQIRSEGHELTAFETFTGGLLAPNPDVNPWEYKFTWNPRNVVMAGNGTVKFIQEGRYKYIPYHRLFRRTEIIHLPGYGYFEGYGNRDSLKYLEVYGLRGIKTLYRGTLRRVGFCKAWDIFVQLGATNDTFEMEGIAEMTHRDFINSFLYYNPDDSVELKVAHYMKIDIDAVEMFKLKWLGIFDREPIGLDKGTPAQILEHILKKKWTMLPEEKDMIVMFHKFNFLDGGQARQINAHLVVLGEDSRNTAMSKTVGLPLGIAAKLIMNGRLTAKGVHAPISPEIYNPILKELETEGVNFVQQEVSLTSI